MQPIDALTLQHLAGELDVKLADGKVNKVQQASHHELLLQLWVGADAGRQKLYINIHPAYAFCALIQDSSFLAFPAKAANFCMVLRKHLLSARIKRVLALPDERVLNLEMENYNELGQQTHLVLSMELMGKNSNIILYDADLNLILGCAHGVSEQMSRQREISVGYPYVPPPQQTKPLIRFIPKATLLHQMQESAAHHEDVAVVLTTLYAGVGKALLKDIVSHTHSPDEAYEALQNLFQGAHLFPAIQKDYAAFSLLAAHQSQLDWQPSASINTMIRDFYMPHLLRERLGAKKQQFLQVLKHQEKKLLNFKKDLEKLEPTAIEGFRKAGDLLIMASSQRLKTAGSSVELLDYDTGQPITLEIDPHLGLSENAQAYYRRYKKAQARQVMGVERAEQITNALDFIRQLTDATNQACSDMDLTVIREDLEAQGWMSPLESRSKGKKSCKSIPIPVTSSDGFTILVGKNGVQNEQIVGKLSRPHDLWLHAHLMPGSHVLIKTEKRTVPDSTLVEAAMLAAYFSPARNGVNVPIIYTTIQHVRKIPNSYPGHVTYAHEQTVNITPSLQVIERLLSEAFEANPATP
jgi:predicted ribosome quality control (RQC) complex YloA/Tae2 family protein